MSANGDRTRPTHRSLNWVWDVNLLTWVAETQPGGGSGGAVTIANGADVAQGTTTDVAWVSGAGTVISLLKKIASAGGSAVSIADGSDVAEGLVADAAVQGDNPGTVSAKLRGLNKSIAAGLPVTGTFFQGIQPISAVSLPLPTLAATSTKQSDGTQKTQVVDGSGNVIGSTGNALDVNIKTPATLPVSIAAAVAVTNTSLDGTTLASIKADLDKIPSQGQALAGASTPVVLTAAQVTTLTPPAAITGFALEAGHLATIDTHIPAQGQALAAASMPVVLTALQVAALTPPAAIVGFALDSTVAKDASLTTIDTDLKATQPRSITNFPAVQAVSEALGANVDLAALLAIHRGVMIDLLMDIRTELRVMNTVQASGLNVVDDLDRYRTDPSYIN